MAKKTATTTEEPLEKQLWKAGGIFVQSEKFVAGHLFIDARNEGYLINRRTKELSSDDIQKIASTYHEWRNSAGKYEDIKGFCNSASIERVKELDYVLTPGRYVGLPYDEDDFDFNERFSSLKAEFEAQLKEEMILNEVIMRNLDKIKMIHQ